MRERPDNGHDDERSRRRAKVVRSVDDDGDEPRRGVPRWVWPAAAMAAVSVLVAVAGGVYALSRLAKLAQAVAPVATPAAPVAVATQAVQPGPPLTPDAKKVYPRDEFRKLVIGKTPQQVIDLLGKPDSTSDNRQGKPETYTYNSRSQDVTAGVTDSGALVDFRSGIVVSVLFY